VELYAAFLAAASDAGAGIQLQSMVQIESEYWDYPLVVWSVNDQAFVFSWAAHSTSWQRKVAKYLPSGTVTSGGTAAVPTPSGSFDNELVTTQGGLGMSGSLSAVPYQDVTTGYPFLTLLNAQGPRSVDSSS
jgi:hypothetical protein